MFWIVYHDHMLTLSPFFSIPNFTDGQLYQFEKAVVPEENEEKAAFSEKLMAYGVSLIQYQRAYDMDDITM